MLSFLIAVQDSVAASGGGVHEAMPWWLELAGVIAAAFGAFVMGKRNRK